MATAKSKPVSKRAIADFIHKWEKLTTNVARNAAELPPHIPPYAAPLQEVLNGLLEIEAAKQNRRAVKQQEVKDSNDLLRTGQELAEKLGSVIIAHHGPTSELLVGYGLKPRRPRKGRKGSETPPPGGPGEPSPEEKSSPQAGGSSKPAAQAAEQPKPEVPAPASQFKPAPQSS